MIHLRKALFTLATIATLSIASALTAQADSVIVGNTFPTSATATVTNVSLVGSTFTFTLTNTSPFDARITGVGFDLPGTAADTFTGTVMSTNPSVMFAFTNTDQNPPQFGNVLDFAFITGATFTGGSPNQGLDNDPGNNSAVFTVTGPFGGLTAAQIEAGLFVRFQRVGVSGEDSDVGRPGTITTPPTAVPEPATMILLGTGLAGIAAKMRRRRKNNQD